MKYFVLAVVCIFIVFSFPSRCRRDAVRHAEGPTEGSEQEPSRGDILAGIVRLDLSMSDLACHAEDYLTTCSIDFEVHSEDELDKVVADIKAVEGVEEVKVKMR